MIKYIFFIFNLFFVFSCDPDGKKNCDWVLEPEPNLKDKVNGGMIPVCARNRETMKQDCRMQATEEFARAALNKKFKYDDVEVETYGIPRTVKNIKFCE